MSKYQILLQHYVNKRRRQDGQIADADAVLREFIQVLRWRRKHWHKPSYFELAAWIERHFDSQVRMLRRWRHVE